jgi:hypothetical protein
MHPRRSPFVWMLGFAALACSCGSSAGSAGAKGGAGGNTLGDGGDAGTGGADVGGGSGTGGADVGGRGGSGGTSTATPGWNLVAIETPKRTYLDYVLVPSSGDWSPDAAGLPQLAQWENVTAHSAVRFRRFTPGDVLTPEEIMALLPVARPSASALSITDAPYSAAPSPADATTAIQKALDDAAAMAKPGAPVDVLVPTGIFNYSAVLKVGADVHLRRSPEDSGGVLHATNPAQEAVRLAGDRSAALFLRLTYAATTRLTTAQSSGIWVGSLRATTC